MAKTMRHSTHVLVHEIPEPAQEWGVSLPAITIPDVQRVGLSINQLEFMGSPAPGQSSSWETAEQPVEQVAGLLAEEAFGSGGGSSCPFEMK